MVSDRDSQSFEDFLKIRAYSTDDLIFDLLAGFSLFINHK